MMLEIVAALVGFEERLRAGSESVEVLFRRDKKPPLGLFLPLLAPTGTFVISTLSTGFGSLPEEPPPSESIDRRPGLFLSIVKP